MEIIEQEAVRFVVKSELVPMITNYIERSEVLSRSDDGEYAEMLVYWDIEEMQHLVRVCGDKVPSPIEKDYSWPGMYTPFKHQETTAAFLSLHQRAFCFNEQVQVRLHL